jgi:rod shape-determining protein MreD
MATFSTQIKNWLLILIGFFTAFVLMFFRLPSWAEWICPQWLVLLLLYFAWAMPYRVNIGVAWIIGILLDLLYNVPVGEHALVLVLATYFVVRFSEKIESLDFWKKFFAIFGLIAGCQLLPGLMQIYLGVHFNFWPILSRSIMSAGVWLIIDLLFSKQRRIYFENYY